MSTRRSSNEFSTKTRRNRPDAPIYMPPAVRNTHSLVSRTTHKENEENQTKHRITETSTRKTCQTKSTNKTTQSKSTLRRNEPTLLHEKEPSENNLKINHEPKEHDDIVIKNNPTLQNIVTSPKIEKHDDIPSKIIEPVNLSKEPIQKEDSSPIKIDLRLEDAAKEQIEEHDDSIKIIPMINDSVSLTDGLVEKNDCSIKTIPSLKDPVTSLKEEHDDKLSSIKDSITLPRESIEDIVEVDVVSTKLEENTNFDTKDNSEAIVDDVILDSICEYNFSKKEPVISENTETIPIKKSDLPITTKSPETEVKKEIIKTPLNVPRRTKEKSPPKESIKLENKKNKDILGTLKCEKKDDEVEELIRASEGLNWCNKRLMKNFNVAQSDVLIINDYNPPDEKVDNWEDLFDDNGELDNSLLKIITKNADNITIPKPKEEHKESKSKKEVDISLTHIVEIYGFPSEFQTRDLITIFEHYRADTYHIKWVDDNHALGIFGSESVALDVLNIQHPLIKLRAMNEASKQSLAKVKKNPAALLPVMVRPQTCPQTARRMVTGALGLKLRSSKEDREKERQILKEAREKKRLAVKQQDDAWEGRISSN